MLNKEQEAEAIFSYRYNKLSESERLEYKNIQQAMDKYIKAEKQYSLAQENCSHPLIMRDTKNEGNTGNWDKCADSYWTSHKCLMCDKRWTTTQDWESVGNKIGHPSDKEARRY